ncbi:MAG: HAD-IA family hydrolase [SAR202 cluster bacterium]|nr:HAD-IA family hydrolase [SAR202 cluster bacterium]MDP6300350.1 HAD-IA family hydrolase [SAR202 cluster bacterium]MDP7103124.1 HAD-IA family hydrolase [SAR202 cluster bacterium]MDP7224511.1 HAD-IA family hydrolase [SAR202 cluster bacterium]MDP7414104.1 HAD-IA family hydrolase [SAR202 cluster bacterium]
MASDRGVEVDAAQFARDWRRRMFELLGKMRAGDYPRMNADGLHRNSLDDVLDKHTTLALSDSERDELNEVWHRLNVWPDATEAIAGLRERYTVVVLTVLSWAIVVDSSKAAGIVWDGVLSCDFLARYKPEPEAYQHAARLLRLEPAQTMMVAAHHGDLRAATAEGMNTAYVPRPGEQGEGHDRNLSPLPEFDINATDFPDLVRQLCG